MAGRSPHQAISAFIEPLQQSLSCISPAVLQYQHHLTTGQPGLLTVNNGDPLTVKVAGAPFGLDIRHHYEVVEADGERGPFKVRSTGYFYGVLDQDGREVFAYHWHPRSLYRGPHLHTSPAAAVGMNGVSLLHGLHVPTGRVAFESVIVLLLEAGVPSRRNDATAVLDANIQRFERWRTWGGSTDVGGIVPGRG